MQFQRNQILNRFLLTACVLHLSTILAAQAARAGSGIVSDSQLGTKTPGSGQREVPSTAYQPARLKPAQEPARLRAARISYSRPNALQEPAQVPSPPASSGPIDLSDNSTSRDKADSTREKSDRSLAPQQSEKLSIRVKVVDLSIQGLGTEELPPSVSASEYIAAEASSQRTLTFKCVHWHPSSICHFPLRFEEAMLERHGHVRFGHLQPLVSGVRFFTTIPLLPYLKTLQPSRQPVYALGNNRPGRCAPLVRDTIPWDRDAAVVEALALAGFFWAVPF